MVVGLDCEDFEKVKGDVNVDEYWDKTKETNDTFLLTNDENKLDVKPDVDKALAGKEDYESVEKLIPKEIEDIQLFKYDDKLEFVEKIKDSNQNQSSQKLNKMTRTLTN